MYDNGRKNGFSLIKLILACLVILLFLFIVMWMIKKSSSNTNLNPLLDGIFRDNINSMQDAGEAYFTNDKLPTEIGEEVKISLQEMLDKNYILPFTDKNGDTCDLKASYVLVVKTENGYELRTYLKCGDESHELVKVLGCHDLCVDCKEKTCRIEEITQYQFVKDSKVTKTTYSCVTGKLSGKNCIITNTDIKAAKTKTTIKTDTKAATETTTKTKVDTDVTKTKVYVPAEKTTTQETKVKKYVDYEVKRIYTDPEKKTETNCVTVKEKDPNCKVQCVPTYVNGVLEEVCNTCGYVYHKECTDTDVWVCPNSYTESGSGSSKTCYKDTYKCPSNISKENQSGSGKDLKCWYYEVTPGTTTYKCPSNISKENQSGSGKDLKCWYYTYNYSCPSTSNYSEGSGKNLKCYTVTTKYSCDTANGWTLKDKNCVKTTTIKTEYCDSGYTLSNSKCSKTTTKTEKAKAKTETITKKVYKWSKEETLSGWKRTGKTKVVKGKEVCE